ncbi:MAG: hypothetical protein ACKVS6_12495, partial [Planctomycetota bacterium]
MNTQPTTIVGGPRRGPIIIIVVMAVLFVALLMQVLNSYESWSKQSPGSASRPAPATRPALPPAESRGAFADRVTDNLPNDAGYAARNLEWGGNLSLLESRDSELLEMGDAEHRMAETIRNIPAGRIAEKATQMPPMAELLANAQLYRGSVFTIRVIPMEINDHTNDIPAGRVISWRMYAMAQRSEKEFIVF